MTKLLPSKVLGAWFFWNLSYVVYRFRDIDA